MTDKELLELAAKAAGLNRFYYEYLGNWGLIEDDPESGWWNPLTDDGDALRLAVKLGLTVCVSAKYQLTWAERNNKDDSLSKYDFDGDPYAATRRAIVRAAAEIGKTL